MVELYRQDLLLQLTKKRQHSDTKKEALCAYPSTYEIRVSKDEAREREERPKEMIKVADQCQNVKSQRGVYTSCKDAKEELKVNGSEMMSRGFKGN